MMVARLGQYEFAVILTVARLGPGAYGAAVRRELSASLRRDQSVGAVYATLQRLEDKGLLASALSDPEPVRGGRARRYYRVTAAGGAALRAMREVQANLLAAKGSAQWRPA